MKHVLLYNTYEAPFVVLSLKSPKILKFKIGDKNLMDKSLTIQNIYFTIDDNPTFLYEKQK